ncbi:Protein of unknown function [Thermobacillus xylanilyticus]|uniref:Uncharacterized protein n=1 Tax=Thermobacillus xylanilyticus TaxID=76633 RepID=A0ABM8V880_THEXY|nr:hypothetical protein [Thermobacillus xylanilyticus]CAG5091893.1 Protein of unknown function [Thermobacillus xylanilyticus]
MEIVCSEYFESDTGTDFIREIYDNGYIVEKPFPHREIKLSYNSDSGIITAKVYRRDLGNVQDEEYNNIVIFSCGNDTIEVKALSGIATIEFDAQVSGTYLIVTKNNARKFVNGSVIINV